MTSNKKTLYVGGLADDVDIKLLRSAFVPFGDIVDVNLPMDYSANKHKGFGFVEFQSPEDAADAIDNMDNGEILGKTIRVNIAKPIKFNNSNNRPIWSDEDYLKKVQSDKETAEVEMEDAQDTATTDDNAQPAASP